MHAADNGCAIYPGSFDPVTYGHIDIIRRALKIFTKVIVAIGDNPSKKPLFTISERKEMLQASLQAMGQNVVIEEFSGLLAEYAKKRGCNTIIRSMRAVSDFDYEFQMAMVNRDLHSSIETVFFVADSKYLYLHSGLAREIAQGGGELSSLVPGHVAAMLGKKYGRK